MLPSKKIAPRPPSTSALLWPERGATDHAVGLEAGSADIGNPARLSRAFGQKREVRQRPLVALGLFDLAAASLRGAHCGWSLNF